MPDSLVYNEDCVAGMSRYADKHFDLAIVDPPYGINMSKDLYARGQSCQKNGYRQWDDKDWDRSPPDDTYFKELFRVSNNQVIWGGNYFPLPPSRCWLVWDKGQREFSFADGELAWTSFDTSLRIFSYSRAALLKENKIHPTQKPVKLYRWILDMFAGPEAKILDTHMGSGSSRIACYDMGYDFTGFEIDKDYVDKAEIRFQAFSRQTKMF